MKIYPISFFGINNNRKVGRSINKQNNELVKVKPFLAAGALTMLLINPANYIPRNNVKNNISPKPIPSSSITETFDTDTLEYITEDDKSYLILEDLNEPDKNSLIPIATKENPIVYDEYGRIISQKFNTDSIPYTINYSYDELGRIKKLVYFNINDKPTEEIWNNYDTDNKIISKDAIQYTRDGLISRKQNKQFDSNGKILTCSENYYSDGQFGCNLTTLFDENSRIKFYYENYYENGRLFHKKETEYFREQCKRTIKDFHYDSDGILTAEIYTSYDNDSKKQLINSKYYDNERKITTNEIITFDSKEQPLSKNYVKYNADNEIIFKTEYKQNEDGELKEIYFPEYNKEINYSQQGNIGDCWLLATINSLSYTNQGRKILNDSITYNDDGTFSIYLKGIDSKIILTEAEVKEGRESSKYSRGDNDVLIIEIAFEKALDKIQNGEIEVDCTNHRNLTIKDRKEDDNSSLNGGFMEDTIFLLTGKDTNSIYSDFDSVFDLMENNKENLCVNISFSNEKSAGEKVKNILGDDIYTIPEETAHVFSIKSVDGDIVTMVNPSDSSKEYQISRETLKECAFMIEYFNFTQEYDNNGDLQVKEPILIWKAENDNIKKKKLNAGNKKEK